MMEEELAPEDDIVLNLQANQPWRGPPNASLLPLVSSEMMPKSMEETWIGSMTGKRGREEGRIESSDVDLSKTARDVALEKHIEFLRAGQKYTSSPHMRAAYEAEIRDLELKLHELSKAQGMQGGMSARGPGQEMSRWLPTSVPVQKPAVASPTTARGGSYSSSSMPPPSSAGTRGGKLTDWQNFPSYSATSSSLMHKWEMLAEMAS
ncbi:hypothetical protein GUITHDRAFT_122986, partial [Guillardia theta CCMP2712]